MEDFSSTVEHLELPRQHVHFDRNRKRAKPCKKGRESLIWFCSHFQFQERVLFAPFWSSKCSNRPCSGFLAIQRGLKCHGIAVKTTTMAVVQLPKSLENRSTTTPLVGIPGRPCLPWTSRNVLNLWLKEKKRKAAEATRHLPAVPWSLPQRFCSALLEHFFFNIINDTRILMRKDDVWSWRIRSTADRPSCEGSDVPCLFLQKVHQPQVPGLRFHCQQGECQKSFWSFNDWAQWQLPDMAFKCLTSMIEEWITSAYCIMSLHCAKCMASYCEMKYRKKLSEGTVWRARSHD